LLIFNHFWERVGVTEKLIIGSQIADGPIAIEDCEMRNEKILKRDFAKEVHKTLLTNVKEICQEKPQWISPSKKQIPRKTCHDCGLEAIDPCETGKGHIPDDENLAPCVYCTRNYLDHTPTNWRADFHDPNWIRKSDRSPTIQDLIPHSCGLLQTLRLIQNEESEKLAQ
jgi:hypothetical protein